LAIFLFPFADFSRFPSIPPLLKQSWNHSPFHTLHILRIVFGKLLKQKPFLFDGGANRKRCGKDSEEKCPNNSRNKPIPRFMKMRLKYRG